MGFLGGKSPQSIENLLQAWRTGRQAGAAPGWGRRSLKLACGSQARLCLTLLSIRDKCALSSWKSPAAGLAEFWVR